MECENVPSYIGIILMLEVTVMHFEKAYFRQLKLDQFIKSKYFISGTTVESPKADFLVLSVCFGKTKKDRIFANQWKFPFI